MLYTIAVVLIILWLLGLVTSTTMGGLVHVLLVIAIIMILVASELVANSGHVGWSYVLDACAFLTYVGLRRLRSRPVSPMISSAS